jgi:HAMP domain-containing protein
VPDEQEGRAEDSVDEASGTPAEYQAAEIVAQAHTRADTIIREARASQPTVNSPQLAALGDNADEIIGQVRKLIDKQHRLDSERRAMAEEIGQLKTERDELVQRLSDAVDRLEELTRDAESGKTPATPPGPSQDATSLSARLAQAGKERQATQTGPDRERPKAPPPATHSDVHHDAPQHVRSDDDRSFYSRHSAKLPRLGGDGGRSVLSAVAEMRPESEPRNRKGRRIRKKT